MATLSSCVRLFMNRGVSSVVRNNCIFAKYPQHIRHFGRVAVLLSEKKFSDKHEWVTVSGNVGTIGISDYAQEALGDIVYAQLPDEDTEFDKDDECGALESVKAASELYTPLSGTVVEKNAAVEETPALINQSCYDKGWLFKLEMKDTAELDDLMSEEQYNSFLKEQE